MCTVNLISVDLYVGFASGIASRAVVLQACSIIFFQLLVLCDSCSSPVWSRNPFSTNDTLTMLVGLETKPLFFVAFGSEHRFLEVG